METYIYVSSLDYYIKISNEEFFRLIEESHNHGWHVSSLCEREEDGCLYITFYVELNYIKKEVGYICGNWY